jgi:hypothetical protein
MMYPLFEIGDCVVVVNHQTKRVSSEFHTISGVFEFSEGKYHYFLDNEWTTIFQEDALTYYNPDFSTYEEYDHFFQTDEEEEESHNRFMENVKREYPDVFKEDEELSDEEYLRIPAIECRYNIGDMVEYKNEEYEVVGYKVEVSYYSKTDQWSKAMYDLVHKSGKRERAEEKELKLIKPKEETQSSLLPMLRAELNQIKKEKKKQSLDELLDFYNTLKYLADLTGDTKYLRDANVLMEQIKTGDRNIDLELFMRFMNRTIED